MKRPKKPAPAQPPQLPLDEAAVGLLRFFVEVAVRQLKEERADDERRKERAA